MCTSFVSYLKHNIWNTVWLYFYLHVSHVYVQKAGTTGCVFIRVCSHSRVSDMFRYLLITRILCFISYESVVHSYFSAVEICVMFQHTDSQPS